VKNADRYQGGVKKLLNRKGLGVLFYVGLIALALLMVKIIPTGYVPLQEQAIPSGICPLPAGRSLERTEKVIER